MRVVEVVLPTGPPTSEVHDDVVHGLDNDEQKGEYVTKGEDFNTDETAHENDDEEYDEGEYDAEAEAEAVARALGNQIWAELGQGLGDAVPTLDSVASVETTHLAAGEGTSENKDALPSDLSYEHQRPLLEVSEQLSQSDHPIPTGADTPAAADPMIETIKTMLSLALSDPHVHYALMTTIVPGPIANGANLYTILSNSVLEGRVNPELAQPLSILISALASGSMLVASESQYPPHPSHSGFDASASPLKRKRDPTDEGQVWPVHPAYNPSVQPVHAPQPARSHPSEELVTRIQTATSDVLQVLDPLLAADQSLSQPAVSSIQRQLHQVYSFVSTCPQQQSEESAGGGSLQEIGGLIQVIGILNGVPIAQSTDGAGPTDSDSTRGGRGASNTIGTSIYTCSTCSKAFNKLSSLRAHERTHSEGRPYRCEYAGCPASFARNHDLRRHEKSHERQMFRCRGCDRLFSRRDALRRHKANEKALDECRDTPMDTSTVQHDGDPPRVTRVWQNHPDGGDWSRESEFEDGEIQLEAIANARHIVGTLYATLQRHVTKGLSTGADVELPNHQAPPSASQSEPPDPVEPAPPAPVPADTPQKAAAADTGTSDVPPGLPTDSKTALTLPGYGLDDEHTSLLEQAIAVAAQAAQAQAEAEAALYEEFEDEGQDTGEWDEDENGSKPEQETLVEVSNLVC